MAIIFVSAKDKQRRFFWSIIISLALFFVILFLIFYIPAFINTTQTVSTAASSANAAIAVNVGILTSPQVENLQPFVLIQNEFTYVVSDQTGKQTTGTISALSQDGAKALLEAAGYNVVSIQPMLIGRSQPFIPY